MERFRFHKELACAEKVKREENFYACVQDFLTKRFSRNVAQRNAGECAEAGDRYFSPQITNDLDR